MSRAGLTKAPCEGCGQPESHGFGREKGKVCRTCAKLIEEARARRADVEERTRRPDLTVFGRPASGHSFGYIPNAGRESSEAFKNAAASILNLLLAESAEGQGATDCGRATWWPRLVELGFVEKGETGPWSGRETPGLIEERTLVAFGQLYRAARAMAQSAYEEGKVEGSRLLLGLASGAVTVDQLNAYESHRSKSLEREASRWGFEATCSSCRGSAELREREDGSLEVVCRACGARRAGRVAVSGHATRVRGTKGSERA